MTLPDKEKVEKLWIQYQEEKEKIRRALKIIDSYLADKEGGDDVIENWDGQTPRDLLTQVKIILTYDDDD